MTGSGPKDNRLRMLSRADTPSDVEGHLIRCLHCGRDVGIKCLGFPCQMTKGFPHVDDLDHSTELNWRIGQIRARRASLSRIERASVSSMSSSASASAYWRVAGMSYLKYSGLCADMVRAALKEPGRTKARTREVVFFRRADWKDGQPQKQSEWYSLCSLPWQSNV